MASSSQSDPRIEDETTALHKEMMALECIRSVAKPTVTVISHADPSPNREFAPTKIVGPHSNFRNRRKFAPVADFTGTTPLLEKMNIRYRKRRNLTSVRRRFMALDHNDALYLKRMKKMVCRFLLLSAASEDPEIKDMLSKLTIKYIERYTHIALDHYGDLSRRTRVHLEN